MSLLRDERKFNVILEVGRRIFWRDPLALSTFLTEILRGWHICKDFLWGEANQPDLFRGENERPILNWWERILNVIPVQSRSDYLEQFSSPSPSNVGSNDLLAELRETTLSGRKGEGRGGARELQY